MSTHEAPHSVGVSPPHESPQVPPLHTSPAPQAIPQPPQCSRSVPRSRHAPSHSVRPAPHDVSHEPALHTSPLAQALPHAPQCAGELSVSTQTPSQRVVPDPHSEPASPVVVTRAPQPAIASAAAAARVQRAIEVRWVIESPSATKRRYQNPWAL